MTAWLLHIGKEARVKNGSDSNPVSGEHHPLDTKEAGGMSGYRCLPGIDQHTVVDKIGRYKRGEKM
jgi:hypothetical protein